MREEFHCPKCGSDDTAALSSVYASGTHNTSMTGLSIDSDGDLGLVGLGGVTHTALAASVRPPEKKSPFGGVMLIVFGVFCFVLALGLLRDRNGAKTAPIPALLGVALTWGAIATLRSGARYNRQEYGRLRRAWERRWMCRRCGTAFSPGQDKASSPEEMPLTKWRISGTKNNSTVTATATTKSATEARQMAESKGIIVSSIVPVMGPADEE